MGAGWGWILMGVRRAGRAAAGWGAGAGTASVVTGWALCGCCWALCCCCCCGLCCCCCCGLCPLPVLGRLTTSWRAAGAGLAAGAGAGWAGARWTLFLVRLLLLLRGRSSPSNWGQREASELCRQSAGGVGDTVGGIIKWTADNQLGIRHSMAQWHRL